MKEITLYKEATVSFVMKLVVIMLVTIAFALGFTAREIPVQQVKEVIGGAVIESQIEVKQALMPSDATQKALLILMTGKDVDQVKIQNLEQQLATVETQNVILQAKVDNALVPEATVKAAAVNHVVEPVKDGFVTVKVKASDIWNAYEFQPEKVKGWISNVF